MNVRDIISSNFKLVFCRDNFVFVVSKKCSCLLEVYSICCDDDGTIYLTRVYDTTLLQTLFFKYGKDISLAISSDNSKEEY